MKRFSKIITVLCLVLSLALLGSCSKDKDKDDPNTPSGDGIEGPIVGPTVEID